MYPAYICIFLHESADDYITRLHRCILRVLPMSKHIYVHTYIHMFYICPNTSTYLNIYLRFTYVQTHLHTYIHTYLDYLYAQTNQYRYPHTCICIHTDIEMLPPPPISITSKYVQNTSLSHNYQKVFKTESDVYMLLSKA